MTARAPVAAGTGPIKPFIVTTALIPGESFRGFVSRALSRTPIRDVIDALTLAEIKLRRPRDLHRIVENQQALVNLARLLDVSPEALISLHHLRKPNTRLQTVSVHGAALPPHYFDHNHRRVSARALKVSPHHRLLWEFGIFNFDPETLETLISHCPECGKSLGWKRAAGPTKCDKCLDSKGRPSVDLREFEQPLVEVSDEVGLRFLCDLVDPDPGRRAMARRAAPPEWSSVPTGHLFEVAMHLVRWHAFDHATRYLRVVRTDDFKLFTPESLALAGRVILTGITALRAASLSERDARHVTSFVDALERDHYTTAGALELVSQALPYRDQRGGYMVAAGDVAKTAGIPLDRLHRLAALGFVHSELVPGKGLRILASEVDDLLFFVDDAGTMMQLQSTLNLDAKDIQLLAESGMLRRVSGRAAVLLDDAEYFSLESARDLALAAQRLHVLKQTGFFADLGLSHVSSAAVLLRLREIESRRYGDTPASVVWHDSIQLVDATAFVAEVLAIEASLSRVPAPMSLQVGAAALGIQPALLLRLGNAGWIETEGGKTPVFSELQIEAARRDFVFEKECMSRFALDSRKQIESAMASLGLVPLSGLGPHDWVYRRDEMQAAERTAIDAMN